MKAGETIAVGWIDGGMVHGGMALGVSLSILKCAETQNPITGVLRGFSTFISKNRQFVADTFMDQTRCDWLLWVDSDIVLTFPLVSALVSAADAETAPLVSGQYMVSLTYDPTGGLLEVRPSASFRDDQFRVDTNEMLEFETNGMGLVLMHRSVIERLREKHGNKPLFDMYYDENDQLVGEDISFFRKVQALGIPTLVHTSAVATHLKTVPIR